MVKFLQLADLSVGIVLGKGIGAFKMGVQLFGQPAFEFGDPFFGEDMG
jgi:hypothetical protein